MDEEELARARNRLAAGRVIAMEKQPYLSKALLAMTPVAREGLGTFAVDKRWRMYYDPQQCLDWTTQEIAAAWLHECGHVMRHHAQRFESYGRRNQATEWNHAADAAINSDLREADVLLPDPEKRFYAESNPLYPDWKPGMTTERMFDIATKNQGNNDEEESGTGSSDPSEKDSTDESEDSSEASAESDDSQDSDSDQNGSDSQSDNESETSNDDASSDDEESSGNSNSAAEEDGNEDSSEEGDSEGSGASQSADGDAEAPSDDIGGDCGSGASGGPPREYEESDTDDGSLDEFSAEGIREQTARDIMDAYNRGTAPGGWAREADEILDPQIDWRQELRAWMRRSVASVAGQQDYSYSRPSRRSRMTGFFLPAMRGFKPPIVRIVLDTSGSMSPEDLSLGLSEAVDIVRQVGSDAQAPIEVINCDAGAHTVTALRRAEDFEILGGGGTDMRKGIAVAAERKPVADVIITITDGGTPWPTEPHPQAPRAQYVVLLTTGTATAKTIPDWMYVIPAEKPQRRW